MRFIDPFIFPDRESIDENQSVKVFEYQTGANAPFENKVGRIWDQQQAFVFEIKRKTLLVVVVLHFSIRAISFLDRIQLVGLGLFEFEFFQKADTGFRIAKQQRRSVGRPIRAAEENQCQG